MSKLRHIQSYLTNDLRDFRGPFFENMARVSGDGLSPESEPSRAIYRVPSLAAFETWYINGIVGGRRPSTYSESPRLWNTYFDAAGQEGVFFGFDLPREKEFQAFLWEFAKVPGALDLTVTDPYKNRAFQVVKDLACSVVLSEQAEHTGTVNHIILDVGNNQILALNTDGLGMIRALQREMELAGKRVLIFGAGGSAASIGYEFVKQGNDLRILNRTPDRAKDLVTMLEPFKSRNRELQWSGFDRLQDWLPKSDIIINTVPEGCPIDPGHAGLLKEGVLLAETTYGHKTGLTGIAGAMNCVYVDGAAMLSGQFVEAMDHVFPILGISAEEHKQVINSLTR